MDNKTKKQITLNIAWNSITTLISFGTTFFLTPIISSKLGIEAYGFVSLANTCITYVDLIAVAVNAFAARYIAIEYFNSNIEKANSYYSSVLAANIIFVILINFFGMIAILDLQNIINISNSYVSDVKVLFYLVLVNYSVGMIGTVFNISAILKNKIYITYRNNGVSRLLYAFIMIEIILFGGIKVYSMAIANVVAGIFLLCVNRFWAKKITPEFVFQWKNVDFKRIQEVVSSGIWNTINNIGTMLNTGLDLLVTNKLLSNVIMGQISVGKQLSSIMTTFTSLFVASFQPKQLEFYAKKQTSQLIKSLSLSMKLSGIIANVIFAGFCGLGLNFIELWLPNQDANYIYLITAIILFGDVIPAGTRPLYYVYTLTNKLKIVSFTTLTAGLVNFFSMLVLLKFTNLQGFAIILTTTVLNVLTSWLNPFFVKRYLELDEDFFSPIMFRHLCAALICSITCRIIFRTRFFIFSSWIGFFIIGCLVGAIALFFSILLELNRTELSEIIMMLKNRIKNNRS